MALLLFGWWLFAGRTRPRWGSLRKNNGDGRLWRWAFGKEKAKGSTKLLWICSSGFPYSSGFVILSHSHMMLEARLKDNAYWPANTAASKQNWALLRDSRIPLLYWTILNSPGSGSNCWSHVVWTLFTTSITDKFVAVPGSWGFLTQNQVFLPNS